MKKVTENHFGGRGSANLLTNGIVADKMKNTPGIPVRNYERLWGVNAMEALYVIVEAFSKLISFLIELGKTHLENLITICFIFGLVFLIMKEAVRIVKEREQTKRMREREETERARMDAEAKVKIADAEAKVKIADAEAKSSHDNRLAEEEKTRRIDKEILLEKLKLLNGGAEALHGKTASPAGLPPPEKSDAKDVTYRAGDGTHSASGTPAASGTPSAAKSGTVWKGIAIAAIVIAFAFFALWMVQRFPSSPFHDVSSGDSYFQAVKWAYENQIAAGREDGTFHPELACTHGNAAAFVERATGIPAPENSFLGPDERECTRGEFITYLWLVVGQPEDLREKKTLRASRYYERALEWAIDNQITSAASWEEFSADAPCLRWHAVTFLYNARNLL